MSALSIEQLAQIQRDFEVLEKRVAIINDPYRYAPLGGYLMEKIYLLRRYDSSNPLLIDFELLYEYWEKIYKTLTTDSTIKRIGDDTTTDEQNILP